MQVLEGYRRDNYPSQTAHTPLEKKKMTTKSKEVVVLTAVVAHRQAPLPELTTDQGDERHQT
jgi:hypothetical protein